MNKLMTSTAAIALLAAAFGLAPAPAEATPPNGGPVQPPSALTVNCPDSIQAAVDQAEPGTPLTVTVSGTCSEEVLITSDDVTVQGLDIISSQVIGGFTVTGAQRVTIKSLTIRDGTIGYPVGVFATRGAAVVLDDIFVSGQGGAGIYVNRNAFADILGSSVENPAGGDNALLINDGGVVRASNSTFSSDNGAPDNGAAVGLFRAASARLDGDVFIENTAPGGLAVQVLHTSNLRVQSSAAAAFRLVNGNVAIGNNSAAHLRRVDVGGDIAVNRNSVVNLVGLDPALGTVNVFGAVTIEDNSLFQVFRSVSVEQGVTCTGGTAGGDTTGGVINDGVLTGTVTGCSLF